MYKDVEDIKNVISNDKDFSRMIETIDDIAIMEWDGNFIDGSLAMSSYLQENNLDIDKIRQIVLFGKKSSTISRNKVKLQVQFPNAEIVVVGKDWRSADIESLHIRHAFVVHIATISHKSARDIDLSKQVTGREETIVRNSRCAYFAVVSSSGSSSLFESSFDCNVMTSLDEFIYSGVDTDAEKTPFCKEKTNGLYINAMAVSADSSFFQGMDEVTNGCETCNQCSNYGKSRQCPAAQRLIAFFYGAGHFVSQDRKIQYQWELKAAKQGYKPAIIETAKHLAEGKGCDKDVEKALNIFDDYASKGNVECAKEIVKLVESNAEVNPIVAVPHLVRLAQDGDEDMCLKLAEGFKEGKYGLPVDRTQEKTWITTGAENGNPRFIKALAESYEADEDLDNSIKWYRKLQEVAPDEVNDAFITEKEKDMLCAIGKTSQGIAELGYKYLHGYGVEYDTRRAYLCFKMSADHDNDLGEYGLGYCYQHGLYVDKDQNRSLQLYNSAAYKNCLRAVYNLYSQCLDEPECEGTEELDYFKRTFDSLLDERLQEDDAYAYRLNGFLLTEGRIRLQDYDEAFSMLVKAEYLGDIYALYLIGVAYEKGYGVEIDNEKAVQYFKEAAKLGVIEAIGDLGIYYYKEHNYTEAFPLLEKASKRGYEPSYYYVSRCFRFGRGTLRDKKEAYQWTLKAAEAGETSIMGEVCFEFFNGIYLPKDYVKSAEWGRKALESGDKSVRFRLAWLLSGAEMVTPDYEKAFNLYQELADEGETAAMNNLGWMYSHGHFVEKNEGKAFEWYLKAAEGGDDVAARNVAYDYRNGEGVEQDYAKSREWFVVAAERGDVSAMKQVALLYQGNFDTENDPEMVVKWYQKAIDAGDDDAIIKLGFAYETGTGVGMDYDKALPLCQQAADKGMTAGFYNLATMYHYGKGVERNEQTAIYWYRKAAAKGYSLAKERLKSLGTNWIDENRNVTDELNIEE